MKFGAMTTMTAALVAAGLLAACAGAPTLNPRQPLIANDGWAAGTDGGSKAVDANVYTVSNRAELVRALQAGGNPALPKIIQVKGTINLSVDDNNKELLEKDYADPAYNFDAYVKAYAPAVWNVKLVNGRPDRKLAGPLEAARERSAENQKKRIVINVTSNTSIVGLGKDAKIVKGNLMIGAGTENVIIRNITFEDAFDYFPGWDPGDSWAANKAYPGCQDAYVDAKTGPQQCPGGRWNSEYDSISVNGGKRVWIDHCTFTDGDRPDKMFPPVFPFPHNQIEQKVQHHDGQVDITNGADLVTLTYNHFKDHDKTSLIGGSDSLTSDAGKLNATFRGNWFENAGQRMPRVRFGKVHSFNNYFTGDASGMPDPKLNVVQNHERAIKESKGIPIFRNGFGIGKDSAIYSENNYFDIRNGTVEYAAAVQGGTKFFDAGSIVNGQPAEFAKALPKLSPDVGWKPTLYGKQPIPAKDVPAYVKANAGAGKL
ncbi:pectate lyase family protein [Uliginosibacterium sp. H1]|uniref:pectate lyase family protein n=1 Tax=Uliginosibacterium sp. H1 TaxID=3114757 RepID=UPI002E17FE82|nr:PbsX family transcriptional regulator [Uliginosibacterium sp. H1]